MQRLIAKLLREDDEAVFRIVSLTGSDILKIANPLCTARWVASLLLTLKFLIYCPILRHRFVRLTSAQSPSRNGL